MRPVDIALAVPERLRLVASRLSGVGRYGPVRRYFDRDEGSPASPAYLARLDAINERFLEWLDPSGIGAPAERDVRREGSLLVFPSARPCGDPRVDRVAVRLYPARNRTSEVAILFHHWAYANRWGAIEFLLGPLIGRFPLAVMVAPHHMMRRRPGERPGEGMLNPNPRHVFEGLRQWQADHAATRALVLRETGARRLVVVGYSLGGYGLLLARIFGLRDPAVTICVTNHYCRGVRYGCAARPLARKLREAGFSWSTFERATRALHLARYGERIGGEGLTYLYARDDRIEPRESLREPIATIRPERVVELPGGHASAGLLRRRIAREIERRAAGEASLGERAALGELRAGT